MINLSIHSSAFQFFNPFQLQVANYLPRWNTIQTIAQITFLMLSTALTAASLLTKKYRIASLGTAITLTFLYFLFSQKTAEAAPIFLHPVMMKIAALSDRGNDKFGVYVTANDLDVEKTLLEIEGKCPINGVHIGVGIGGSLDIAAYRHSQFIIIADYGTKNKEVIDLMRHVLLQNPEQDQKEFVSSLIEELKKYSFIYGEDILDRSLEQRLKDQLTHPTSWLSHDDSFNHIKNLFNEGKIIAITLDMAEELKVEQLANILKSNQLEIDTMYLCNSRHFISNDKQISFARSLNQLLDDHTLLIHCPSILPWKHNECAADMSLPIQNQKNSRRQSVITGAESKNHFSLYFVRDAQDSKDVSIVGPSFKSTF